MRILLLAAAIRNAVSSPLPGQSAVYKWADVTAQPVINDGTPYDVRNPTLLGNTSLVGVGKFGEPCFEFNGSEWATWDNALVDLNTDFTIECFVNWGAVGGNENQYICDIGNNGFVVRYYTSGGSGGLSVYAGGSGEFLTTNVRPPANQWFHLAVTSRAGAVKMFLDGELIGEGTYFFAPKQASYTLGNYGGTGPYATKGRISQFRVTKSCLYASNFIPPTQAFTVGGN